ncbi:MAG TPA: lyase family protein [Balneolales bacterium]|nr:lyase family protein [Balneolales bacterium]
MKTLWQHSNKPYGSDWFFNFTAAEDRLYDEFLIPYDVFSNIAQVMGLHKISLLNGNEKDELLDKLREIYQLWDNNEFHLNETDEDVHSAIEKYLTSKCGDTGKKIHAGRSRNDLILSDIRLYTKVQLRDIFSQWLQITDILKDKTANNHGIFFPGYTHTQPAMPNSADAWFMGYLELFMLSFDAVIESYYAVDSSPLGSAAGFGVPHIKIDKSFIADTLGFSKPLYAVTSAQLFRGLAEQKIISALNIAAQVYNRMASDIISYVGMDKQFVQVSDDQVSGSSIMPQKRNPDVWELIRGESHVYAGWLTQLYSLTNNMSSGYHRDLQLVKKILMDALNHMKRLNDAVIHALKGVSFNKDACEKALSRELFATHIANKLTLEGMPFREAYQRAGSIYPEMDVPDNETLSNSYHHEGAPGKCDAQFFDNELQEYATWLDNHNSEWSEILNKLLSN